MHAHLFSSRFWAAASLAGALCALACTDDGGPSTPNPVEPVASAAELQALVGALSHDSLRGRRASSPEDQIATEFVAALVDEFGLIPATGGGFFRSVPGEWRTITGGTVAVDQTSFTLWSDFVPVHPRTANPVLSWDATSVYGGSFTSASGPLPAGLNVAGRAVVMEVVPGGPVLVSLSPDNPLAAAAVVFLVGESMEPGVLAFAQARRLLAGPALRSTSAAPPVLMVTRAVAEQLMGESLTGMQPGHQGPRIRGEIHVATEPASLRNVVAVLPGSDADAADEYVVMGAHLDHLGVRQDNVAADSIFNGADDNASGSAALLMLARHFANRSPRPRRSLAFIWFAAEELGLVGSEAFTFAPNLPLPAVSAFVNLDMVSRGGAADIDGGGPAYVQSIGSRRRSTVLGPLVDSVAHAHGMELDYTYDAAGHPERVFCRSDQWNFARFGVPVVFLTTGLHPEYHAVDDEVDRADFDKLARVTTFVGGIVDALASRPAILPRNVPAPDPNAVCVQ